MFTWKIIQHGLMTRARARKWGIMLNVKDVCKEKKQYITCSFSVDSPRGFGTNSAKNNGRKHTVETWALVMHT